MGSPPRSGPSRAGLAAEARRTGGDPQLGANADFVRAYVDRGELGVKTERGFYTYPTSVYRNQGFIEGGA